MKKKVVLVVPVYNEEDVLEQSIRTIRSFVQTINDYTWEIIIANNASTDKTRKIADSLSIKHKNVSAVHVEKKGRGNALRTAWTSHESDIYAYCDVDLATDLSALPSLIKEIENGADMAVGSRYLPHSETRRNPKRLLISKVFIRLIHILFSSSISDYQCGFKALNKKVVQTILPYVKDDGWFFDTELVLIGEKSGLDVTEIPVRWTEGHRSKVHIIRTCFGNFKKLVALRLRFWKKS